MTPRFNLFVRCSLTLSLTLSLAACSADDPAASPDAGAETSEDSGSGATPDALPPGDAAAGSSDVLVISAPPNGKLPAPPPLTDACEGEQTAPLDLDFGKLGGGETFDGDPLDDGPLQVVTLEDLTLDNPDADRDAIRMTIYAPSNDGEKIAKGPHPLMIILPGFSGDAAGYGHFSAHFASHGIAVLAVTPPNANFLEQANHDLNVIEIQAALDWALGESELAGKIDEDKLGVSGHSLGGKLSFYMAAADPRIKLVIAWDPQNSGGPPCFDDNELIGGLIDTIGDLVAGGGDCNAFAVAPNCSSESPGESHHLRAESITFATRDGATTPDTHHWGEHFYRGAPSPAHLVRFDEAEVGHAAWGLGGGASDITKRVHLALVLNRFFGTKGLGRYLPGGKYLQGEATVVEVLSK